ncbi:MAG TPA: hypothetical protein VF601_13935 [Beijerinckiaceae bacterium]
MVQVSARLPALELFQPTRSHHGEESVAVVENSLDVIAKVDSKRDAVDIDENVIGSVMLDQLVEDPAAHASAVGSPIRQNDFRHELAPRPYFDTIMFTAPHAPYRSTIATRRL